MKTKLFIFVISLFTFSLCLFGQTLDKFNRQRSYDVQNYIIRVSFDQEKRAVFGETTVQVKPLSDNFTMLELDAVNLNFESVKLDNDGKDLVYTQVGEKIRITLDKAYTAKDLVAVRFKYSTVTCKDFSKIETCKGVYFTKQTGTKNWQIWTQGEPEEAHHWFPSYDFPDDKATTEQFITVKSDEVAIGNGELIEVIENTDKTKTFHFKTNFAYSTYLVSMIVGKFSKIEEKYKNVPLGYYVYSGTEPITKKVFANTSKMFEVFEDLTKIEFPYNKYDQTIVSQFTAGGMENMTATTLDDSSILSGFNYGAEDLISHELAHSWFGNLVTCRNWAELWLNEGFATYMEAAYREKVYGRSDYIGKIKDDAVNYFISEIIKKNKRGLYNQLAMPDDSIFDAITYQKGGVVLHQLREQIGTEKFWKAVNLYLNRHKFANVESPDLQKAMEEVSGQKLDWFFKQWVYGAGYPNLSVSSTYSNKKKILSITVSQTQKAENLQPEVFILPLELEITSGKETKKELIEVNQRSQTFNFQLQSKPSKIKFDSNEKIVLKKVKESSIKTVK